MGILYAVIGQGIAEGIKIIENLIMIFFGDLQSTLILQIRKIQKFLIFKVFEQC